MNLFSLCRFLDPNAAQNLECLITPIAFSHTCAEFWRKFQLFLSRCFYLHTLCLRRRFEQLKRDFTSFRKFFEFFGKTSCTAASFD